MFDLNYIKSWAGLLKIGEFFCLLVAFSSLAHFSNRSENTGGFQFFLFVTVTSWLVVMLVFGLFVTKTHERIPINWTLTMILSSAIKVFLLLIASSVVAEKARRLRRNVLLYSHPHQQWYEDRCDFYSEHAVPCSNVEAAVVFGFLALALFLADVVFYFMKYRAIQHEQMGGAGFVQEPSTTTDNVPSNSVDQIP